MPLTLKTSMLIKNRDSLLTLLLGVSHSQVNFGLPGESKQAIDKIVNPTSSAHVLPSWFIQQVYVHSSTATPGAWILLPDSAFCFCQSVEKAFATILNFSECVQSWSLLLQLPSPASPKLQLAVSVYMPCLYQMDVIL